MSDILIILLGVLITLGTAIFVAAEFSLVTLDPSTIDKQAKSGDKSSAWIANALKRLSLELSSSQVGITITSILLGYTTQPALSNVIGLWFSSWMAQSVATALAVVISLVLVNIFSMVFGEIVPKNIAVAEPIKTALVAGRLQSIFTFLFKPLILLLNGMANIVLHTFGIKAADEISGARSASELAALVRHSAKEGTLDVSIATLLTRSIGMGKLTAVDVMTPRGQMDFLERNSTAQDVVDLARKTGHSRFPVVGENLDDVLGFVNLRRAVNIPYQRRASVRVTTQTLISLAPKVPETIELAPLLMQLRDGGNQIAVVVDEYGGTSGIVTLEDVIEEVVGDVADEHDPRSVQYRKRADGAWEIEGTLRPDEVLWETGILIPEDGPYETVGGFMMMKLGRIPQVGDSVSCDDVLITVQRMDGRRVERVKAQRIISGQEEARS